MEELTGALSNSDKGWTILTPPACPSKTTLQG